LHIYDGVGHGFGIRPGNTGPVAAWPTRFLEWLDQQGLAKRREHADTRRAAFNEGWRFFRGDVPGGESPGFNALLIVRSKSGASGPIPVAASGDGLTAGHADIMAQAMTPLQ